MSRRRLGACIAAGVAAAWAAGRALGDGTWAGGLLFFIPSPVAAMALVVAAALEAHRGRRRVATAAVLLALIPVVVGAGAEHRWRRVPSEDVEPGVPRVRVVHWNVFWGRGGLDAQVARLRELDADLVLLSEYPKAPGALAALRSLGDDRRVLRRSELVAVARGRLEHRGVERVDGGKAWRLRWHRDEGRPLELLFVDLRSSLGFHRDPVLRWVTDLAKREQPDLVVGDFNAPRRSSALRELPAGYRNAYDAAGSGWSFTWPVPVPLWAIDQCIVGPGLVPTRYQLRSAWPSDHRIQVLDASVRMPDAAASPVS